MFQHRLYDRMTFFMLDVLGCYSACNSSAPAILLSYLLVSVAEDTIAEPTAMEDLLHSEEEPEPWCILRG